MAFSVFFAATRKEIKIEILESDEATKLDLNFSRFDVILQRVITPVPQSSTAVHRRKVINKAEDNSSFSRLFFVQL